MLWNDITDPGVVGGLSVAVLKALRERERVGDRGGVGELVRCDDL